MTPDTAYTVITAATLFSTIAVIPGIYRAWTTRDASSYSMLQVGLQTTGTLLWAIYYGLENKFIAWTSSFSHLFFLFSIVIVKGHSSKRKQLKKYVRFRSRR